MEIGKNYIRSIISEVLPAIAKENAALQSDLVKMDDKAAEQTYREFVGQTDSIVKAFLESEIEQFKKIRKVL
ncbi:hypothetical protein LK494_03000 [Anaerovorax odorimutans]|nr:hypothetical protein [Anaerovorax odorimutans]